MTTVPVRPRPPAVPTAAVDVKQPVHGPLLQHEPGLFGQVEVRRKNVREVRDLTALGQVRGYLRVR
jgi:hypothetical protein